jgi:hypothetical protein
MASDMSGTTISRDVLEARLRENVFMGGYRDDEFAEAFAGDEIVAADVLIPLETLYSAMRGKTIAMMTEAIDRVISGALRDAGYRPTWVKAEP